MTLIIAAAQLTSIAGEIESNVANHPRFGTIAAEHGARLVVFPELSLTGYEPGIARSSAIRPEGYGWRILTGGDPIRIESGVNR
jgi:predicted amidohydrolase